MSVDTAGMLMPETPSNVYDLLQPAEYKVGFSGKSCHMQPVPEPQTGEQCGARLFLAMCLCRESGSYSSSGVLLLSCPVMSISSMQRSPEELESSRQSSSTRDLIWKLANKPA